MRNSYLIYIAIVLSISSVSCENSQIDTTKKDEVVNHQAKNIILMIGDGMGIAQIHAGLTANKGHLELERCKEIGFSKTSSSNSYITDSGAGATAFSIGMKTFNGAIGVDKDTMMHPTILEQASQKGWATGLIATSEIVHATPAAFIAHQANRRDYENIALDFLKTPIDVFIGGGRQYFETRSDKQNLLDKLIENGYEVVYTIEDIVKSKSDKLVGLTAQKATPKYSEGRGDMLQKATLKAINILQKNKNGFFLVVEGSQIDWGGHANDLGYVVDEMLDFDRTIGKVLDFADANGETLVIITADHETGGLALDTGSFSTGEVKGKFTTDHHTGVMVPVFSYGPQANQFKGIYENTAIYTKIKQIMAKE